MTILVEIEGIFQKYDPGTVLRYEFGCHTSHVKYRRVADYAKKYTVHTERSINPETIEKYKK